MSSNVGDTLTVTGVVSQTTSGYRLLPRDQQDIVVRTEAENQDPAVAGTLGSSGGGGAGIALSGAALLSMAGSAGVYYLRKRAAAKLVTA